MGLDPKKYFPQEGGIDFYPTNPNIFPPLLPFLSSTAPRRFPKISVVVKFAKCSAGDPPAHVSVKFTDSTLQTFSPTGAQGKISGGSRPPRDADDTFSKPASGFDEPQQTGWLRNFTIAAYRPYFDVDTSDALERIKDSPSRSYFISETHRRIAQG